MIGKRIKVNDYKFIYGQETVYINVYGAFKNKKNGNKYIVYSYDNTKLYFGSLFIRNNEAIIMVPKEEANDIVKEFVFSLMENKNNDVFEIIFLNDVNSAQIIDESLCNFSVDIVGLSNLTIPEVNEVKVKVKQENKKKKKPLIFILLIILAVLLLSLFFVKDYLFTTSDSYLCEKSYLHDELPANIREKVTLVFDYKNEVNGIDIETNYVFSDATYYQEFKDNSYFYKYIDEGDNYKFDDVTRTYKLFSSIDVNDDFMKPNKLDELISYYKDNNYSCKKIENE